MKTVILALIPLLFYTNTFAQDRSSSEADAKAYRQLPDGSSVYVGKCATHEDHLSVKFKVTGIIQESVSTVGMKSETAGSIFKRVGAVPFRMMMKEFFDGLADLSSDSKLVSEFIDYADDLEIDAIQLVRDPSLEFLRFNVGFGGGNGGFLVLQKTSDGWLKISTTEDGELKYCDSMVWGK